MAGIRERINLIQEMVNSGGSSSITQNAYISVSQGQNILINHEADSYLKRIVQINRFVPGSQIINTNLDFDIEDENLFNQEDSVNGTDILDGKVILHNTDTTTGTEIIYFIDTASGNDLNTGLTKETALQTLDEAWSRMAVGNDYILYLGNGSYVYDIDAMSASCDGTITIIGNRKTVLLKTGGFFTNTTGNVPCNWRFYHLIWDGTNDTTGSNANCLNKLWQFYNVVFRNIPDNGYSYFSVSASYPTGGIEMFNCIQDGTSTNMLRATSGTIRLTNCIGNFSAGYGTTQTNFNTATNYFNSACIFDSDYRCSLPSNIWLDVGTGTDAHDGTTADLGVYGGSYSWSFPLFLNPPTFAVSSSFISTTDSNHIPLINIQTINSVNISAAIPSNTGIKGLVSFDGRVTWNKWSGDSWVNVSAEDLSLFDFNHDPNIIGTGFASSESSASYGPDKLFDQSASTYWSTSAGGSSSSQFWGAIFGQLMTIESVTIRRSNTGAGAPTNFSIKISTDTTNGTDGTWETIKTGLNHTAGVGAEQTFDLGGIRTCKGIKLTANTILHTNGYYYVQAAEMYFTTPKTANTTDEIEAGLNSLTITDEIFLDFVFDLSTNDTSFTPSIDQIKIDYNELGSYSVASIGSDGNAEFDIDLVSDMQTSITKLSAGTTNIKVNILL